MYDGKIAPATGANRYHILRIKTSCHNPNKNIMSYTYFLIQNNIIEQLIELKSNQLKSQ